MEQRKTVNDFSTSEEIPSILEASVLKDPEAHGGSGFEAATVQDLGVEPTLGEPSGGRKAKRVRKRVIGVRECLSAARASAGGVSAGPKRASKKIREGVSGGAMLSLKKDVGAVHGQPEPTSRAKATVKAE